MVKFSLSTSETKVVYEFEAKGGKLVKVDTDDVDVDGSADVLLKDVEEIEECLRVFDPRNVMVGEGWVQQVFKYLAFFVWMDPERKREIFTNFARSVMAFPLLKREIIKETRVKLPFPYAYALRNEKFEDLQVYALEYIAAKEVLRVTREKFGRR